jgi:mycofactocin system creatininase family protein
VSALGDLTWPDIDADHLLAVPVGSTEQHGPHLPLSTDTDVAVALARALADRRGDVLVAPPVAYGSSGEHQAFPGTLSIGPEVTELLLVELGRSATETFTRILLISGHGGNAIPVNRAVRRLRSEGRDALAWGPRWRGDPHAGRTETSVQLALHPALVQVERAEAGNTASLDMLMPALREGGVRPVSPNGVLGDPAGASVAEGAALLAEAVEDLATTVSRWLGESG